jgi:hypothetical protein
MTQETPDGVPISDGFDFPVGPRGDNVDVFKTHKIDAVLADPGYYETQNHVWHPGEDWNGRGGGDTDLGDPIYAISHGRVTDFGHYPVFGNIVLLEHALPDGSRVWSQYAHLDQIMVNQKGQKVTRGQQIGTMGKGDQNRFIAHLHFEMRKNKLPINNWSPMVKDRAAVLANYYSPTDFIKTHRPGSFAQQPVAKPVQQPIQTIQPIRRVQPVRAPQPQLSTQLVINIQQANPQVGTFNRANVPGWQSAPNGFKGNMLWAPSSTQEETYWAEWRPALPTAGQWEVWAYIPNHHATTTYARYRISHLDGQTEAPVNQSGYNNEWAILGTYRFAPGQGYVRLTNFTGEFGKRRMVGFDSICFTKAG